MHNHGTIKHSIAISNKEICIETSITSNKIVCSIDKCIDALCKIGLLVFFDCKTFKFSDKKIYYVRGHFYLIKNVIAGVCGLLECIPKTLYTSFCFDSTITVVLWVIIGNRKGDFYEWRLL